MDIFRVFCCCSDSIDDITDETEIITSAFRDFVFRAGGRSSQHPIKANSVTSVNADAYITSVNLIGVADGVSSVELEGYDPSLLPLETLTRCRDLINARCREEEKFDSVTWELYKNANLCYSSVDFAKHVLSRAFAECIEMGSTTCLIAMVYNRRLYIANVGDSQLILLRRTNVPPKKILKSLLSIDTFLDPSQQNYISDEIYKEKGGYKLVGRTASQQYFFNCPYQLTRMPDVDCSQKELLRRASLATVVSSYDIQEGDILVMGTDGLFDNLFDYEIAEICDEMCWASGTDLGLPSVPPDVVAETVLQEALKCGCPSENRITPFSVSAAMEIGRAVGGGKPDDTTVIVGYIQQKWQSIGSKYKSIDAIDSNRAIPLSNCRGTYSMSENTNRNARPENINQNKEEKRDEMVKRPESLKTHFQPSKDT